MKTIVRALCGVMLVGLIATPGRAQDAAPAASPAPPQEDGFLSYLKKTELSATVDTYFHYNFNGPATGSPTLLRNFDTQHHQFRLALAELALSRPPTAENRLGFRLDLDAGAVARTVNSFDPAGKNLEHVQQVYASFLVPVGSGLTVDAGKFVTPHGAEVIEARDNWNYSRSFLFALAIPYYHMGVRAGYSPNAKLTLGGSVTNGWNNVTDNNSQKTYGAQAIVKPIAPFSVVLNYMAGPEQTDNADDWRHLFDTTLTYTVNDKLSLMGNYDYGRDKVVGQNVTWQGVGLYAKAQPNKYFALVPRFEYYDDADGFTTGAAQALKEFTLTAELNQTHGLLTRFEYRRDWSDVAVFPKRDGSVNNQNTFTVGIVYAFSLK